MTEELLGRALEGAYGQHYSLTYWMLVAHDMTAEQRHSCTPWLNFVTKLRAYARKHRSSHVDIDVWLGESEGSADEAYLAWGFGER